MCGDRPIDRGAPMGLKIPFLACRGLHKTKMKVKKKIVGPAGFLARFLYRIPPPVHPGRRGQRKKLAQVKKWTANAGGSGDPSCPPFRLQFTELRKKN